MTGIFSPDKSPASDVFIDGSVDRDRDAIAAKMGEHWGDIAVAMLSADTARNGAEGAEGAGEA